MNQGHSWMEMAIIGTAIVLAGIVGALAGHDLASHNPVEMPFEPLGFCAYHCSEHSYPEKIVYNGRSREVSCLCADGLMLSGIVPSKESKYEHGSSHENL